MASSKRRETLPWMDWKFSWSWFDCNIVVSDEIAAKLGTHYIRCGLQKNSIQFGIRLCCLTWNRCTRACQEECRLWLRLRVVTTSIEPTFIIHFVLFIEWIDIFSFRRYSFEQDSMLGKWTALTRGGESKLRCLAVMHL